MMLIRRVLAAPIQLVLWVDDQIKTPTRQVQPASVSYYGGKTVRRKRARRKAA